MTEPSMAAGRSLHFLLVEDDDTHAAIVMRCIRRAGENHTVAHVPDGADAMSYLRFEKQHINARRPHVVLLDLKLPRMDGHEVLRAIRADKNLHMLPVVVITTSNWDSDLERAFASHANGYVVKDFDFEQFCGKIGDVVRYWSHVSLTPPAKPMGPPRDPVMMG